MMEQYELQKLRDLPIEGVAERLGLRVSRHKCLCPFHDDHHASLSFNLRKNTYRCFVCGASGGTIDLVMRHLRMDFKDACRWLADGGLSLTLPEREGTSSYQKDTKQVGFDPKKYECFFERPWLSDRAKEFLFGERMINPRVVSWCRLTSWTDRQGVNWLQIPYFDVEGKLIGVQNRNLKTLSPNPSPLIGRGNQQDEQGVPRFRFPSGSRCSIYNLPILKLLKPSEPLYITEGASDCWAMLSSGHKAIAIPSATLLKSQDVELITRPLREGWGGSLHMYPDKDEPGERLFLQLKELLEDSSPMGGGQAGALVHHQLPLGCKDFSDYYVSMKRKEVQNG